MTWFLGIPTALAFGIGSALIPVVNAEAFALVSIAANPWLLAPMVIALALGQTIGKLALFEAARRGSARFGSSRKLQTLSSSSWAERTRTALTRRGSAVPLMLTSASLGLPPLAFVSVAAGAAGQRRRTFALLCFIGRTARFTALAVPVAFTTTLA